MSYAKCAQDELCRLCGKFVHTLTDFLQTLNRHYADYHTRVYLAHFSVVISGKVPYCALIFAGPTWHQRDGSVLVASRRFDGSRSRKTKGSLADTLQCNIWRRAQSPHRMTHSLHGGGLGHSNGFTALGKTIGTPKSTDKDSAYVTEHPVLKYFRAKLANFLNDLVCRIKSAVCILSAFGVHTVCIKCAD